MYRSILPALGAWAAWPGLRSEGAERVSDEGRPRVKAQAPRERSERQQRRSPSRRPLRLGGTPATPRRCAGMLELLALALAGSRPASTAPKRTWMIITKLPLRTPDGVLTRIARLVVP